MTSFFAALYVCAMFVLFAWLVFFCVQMFAVFVWVAAREIEYWFSDHTAD
jgi:hypothetical protein